MVIHFFSICSECCVKCRKNLKKLEMKLPKKAPAPFTSGYCPDLDITHVMDSKEGAHFHSIIIMLQWVVELCRVDITVETLLMDLCMAMNCLGNIEQLFHIFELIHNKHNTEMVLDPSNTDIGLACFYQ